MPIYEAQANIGVKLGDTGDSGGISSDDLATGEDITNGTAGKVVDAAQLKSSIDSIQEVLDEVRTYTLLLNGL